MLPPLLISYPNPTMVRVDKATSELLISPDWVINMEICDAVNHNHRIAKEVIKAVKGKLQFKNPKIQMLTLTLLETLVKNCEDRVHFHIANRKILDDMVKIVKKKGDMQVRLKILVLVDSWQEAFGGATGKHIHYHLAYNDLRRCGVQFPQRSFSTAPIITPPAPANFRLTYGTPTNPPRSVDAEALSASSLEAIHNAAELLADMLHAINPTDPTKWVKDEVIVDLAEQCHTNQTRLMQMLTNTTDEKLLSQGVQLNDTLQHLLGKHDAIASGSALPTTHSVVSRAAATFSANTKPRSPTKSTQAIALQEQDEDESPKSECSSSSSSNSTFNNALVEVDSPSTANSTTTKEQETVDFLSIVLSTSLASEPEPNSGAYCAGVHAAPWAQAQTHPPNNPFGPNTAETQFGPTGPFSPQWATTPAYPKPTTGKPIYTPIQSYQNQQIQIVNPSPTMMSMNSVVGSSSCSSITSSSKGQKPYVPSYRLFEDLNVFGGVQGKMRSSAYPSVPSSSSSVVGARR